MRILSVVEFAEHIGSSRQLIGNYCREGKLPSYRLGKRWLIPVDSAIQFCRSRNIPLNGLAKEVKNFIPRILVVESGNTFTSTFTAAGWEAVPCPSLWFGGSMFGDGNSWQAVLIDSAGISTESRQIVNWISENVPTVTVGVLTYDGQESWDTDVKTYPQPAAPELVVKDMRAAVEGATR